MGSEITYAEVNFRNGPSPVQPKASPENKTPPTVFQKVPPWCPWVTSGALLLLSIVLLAVIFFLLWGNSDDVHKRLPQNATDWHCLLKKSPKGKEEMSCCLQGWVQHGSSCYYFSQKFNAKNWGDSRQNCIAMGSDLVVVNSEAEQDFLNRHAETLTTDVGFWIGLSDPEGQNKWQWVDETPLNNNAEFWRRGEPSNLMERCGVMSRTKYTKTNRNWNDIMCTEKSPHICEAKPIIFH